MISYAERNACSFKGWSTTRSGGTSTALRSSTAWAGTRASLQGLEQGRLQVLLEGRLPRQRQRLQSGRQRATVKEKAARVAASMGIATGAGSGATLNRGVAKWTSSWRTSGEMARATPRVVTIRSPTVSKRTRTSWRTWRNLGAIAACAPWNTVSLAVMLRTGSRHCKNSMRMRRCRVAPSPLQD